MAPICLCAIPHHIVLHDSRAEPYTSQGDWSHVSNSRLWSTSCPDAFKFIVTPPIAHFSERYNSRRIPLLAGQVALVGAQIMLMEAPKYWVMVLARIIQGISSSVVWVVGLALLYACRDAPLKCCYDIFMVNRCDTAPESSVGSKLSSGTAFFAK